MTGENAVGQTRDAIQLPTDGRPPSEGTLVLDQRWSDLCVGLHDLQMKFLDSSCDLFRTRLVETDFGGLRIRRVVSQGGAHRAQRTKSMIGLHDPHLLWICVILKGRLLLQHNRQATRLEEGDLSILDYAQTYSVEVCPPLIDSLWIGAPRSLVESYIHDVDEMFGLRIDRSLGTTQMAWRVTNALFTDPKAVSAAHSNRVVSSVLAILSTAFDGSRSVTGRSSYRAHVLRRIKRYIDAHLEDDDLTVASVAREQGISTRYLAKLFEGEEQSAARWIWDRRLERCHSAMRAASPGTTIAEIAYSNGFKNLSHFCRVFKARYGESPGAYIHAN